MQKQTLRRMLAASRGLVVVIAALFPVIAAMFQLAVGLNQVDKMKANQLSAIAELDNNESKVTIELAGKYTIDPQTMDPGLRLRRVRTMQP